MEKLLKAQRLAVTDVGRGVTMEMVKKNRDAHAAKKGDKHDGGLSILDENDGVVERLVTEKVSEMVHAIATEALKKDAVDHLLATIDATEALEHQLRAKYNL
jgi:hypothetical protein